MANTEKQKSRSSGKKTRANQREGDTSRTSSQGRKEASGGGKGKKGNSEADKNIKARKI